jgi:hypothetical protein
MCDPPIELLDDDERAEPTAPEGVLEHVWRDWKRHRGKPLSKEAMRRQHERLAELKAMGHDPNAVILQSIERGWSGLFELKRQTGPLGRAPTLTEQRVANIDSITGKSNGRHIEGTSERLDSGPIPALPGDLREQGGDDVGRRRSR